MKKLLIIAGVGSMLFSSCVKDTSNSTGWAYNDPNNGGFENPEYFEQETGPGLVLIQGGTFSMGRKEQDVLYEWNNFPRRVTVPSFYLDQWEVRNIDYREYLYWLKRVFIDYPEVYTAALPDTLVWRKKLGYNTPYVDYYFRHPAYKDYPVVGVNWIQANDYCAWRTDRVNEMIMVREGLLFMDPSSQSGEENFNTEAYLAGQYEGMVRDQLEDLSPNADFRKVRMEDGIFLPKYRLPTEAEWEFAAYALIGNMMAEERIFSQKIYPWNGHYIRVDDRSGFDVDDVGKIRANTVRGRGDYMGVAGALNDANAPTAPVNFYWPNAYGVYAMAGNVNEWVMDVYRKLSYEDMDEFRPFRGNVFQTQVKDEEGLIAEKDSLGKIQYRNVTDWEAFDRRNYNTADNINYSDGDYESSIEYSKEEASKDNTTSTRMYWEGDEGSQVPHEDRNASYVGKYRGRADQQSLVNNRARVIKGGGWRDRAYWMSPGNRRYWPEDMARDDLGFRCAMDRVGGPVGME
ncbi:MAG: SUMF1/EgtB/PvdO family nonheme iron enzyme [Bacteroidales bacterium]|nr:SUMF1/EgtB/PvdO family nonheme iron enzyme [Bacteroidales bacterium]